VAWDCPQCGLVNPAESRRCDCGYDIVARQFDQQRGPHGASSPGWYAGYQLVRLAIGGFACGIFGIVLCIWELSDAQGTFWGIFRAVLITLFGFGLLAWVVRQWTRSG
jgi:hypothetical protein